jgi:hypothetical protein
VSKKTNNLSTYVAKLKEIEDLQAKLKSLIQEDKDWRYAFKTEQEFIIEVVKNFPNRSVFGIVAIVSFLEFPRPDAYISRKIWGLIDAGVLNFLPDRTISLNKD